MTTGKSPSGSGASRSKVRPLHALLFACATLLALAACAEPDDRVTLRVAHSNSPTHPVNRALEHMADVLEDVSGGAMTLRIYPSEQLGSERQAIELVQIGSLDICKTSAAVMEAFAPEYGVFGVPYLFESAAHEKTVLQGPIGDGILERGAEFRLRGLCYFDAGARSFYTVEQPVRTPEDLRGLKIRTQSSPSAIKLVEAMGATPTPISFSELYTALQQGVVDGAENNPPSYHLTRHYEVAPYYSLNEHTAVPDVLLIGTRTWDKLTNEQRVWLDEAVDAAEARQRELWAEAEREALEAVQEDGATVIRPDRAPFAARVADFKAEAKQDPALGPLLQRIEQAADTAVGGAN